MFYRIDGIGDFNFGNLSSARFFALAERLVCYAGSVRIAMLSQLEEEQDEEPGSEMSEDDEIAASLKMESL